MKTTRRFVVKFDDNYDMYGLSLDIPNYNVISGTGVFHDMMEHTRNDKGACHEELMAFGAIIFVRGNSGWYSSQFNLSELGTSIGYNLTEILIAYNAGADWQTCKPTYPCEDYAENQFKLILQGLQAALDDTEIEIPEKLKDSILHWMRKGYRKASKRYENVDTYSMIETFWKFCKDSHILNTFNRVDYLDYVVSVTFDADILTAKIVMYYPGGRVECEREEI